MDSSLNWDAEKMLKRYIYDYLVRKNLHTTALTFRNEVDVPLGPVAINDSVEGFLSEWWQIFFAIYFGISTSQDPRVTCEAVVQRLNERLARKMEQSSSNNTRAAIPILQRPPPLMFVPGVPSGLTNYSSLDAMKDFRSFATQPVDHCLRNINPNLRAPNNIRPPGLATSSTNLIRNFFNVGSKRNAQPANLDSKRPKVNVTPIAFQVPQIYRPPKINVPVIGLPHTAPTRFASPVALQNEGIALPNFGLNQFLMPTLQAYIQEQALLQRNSVADNLVRRPQTDSSMEMLAQSNKGKQVEEKNEGKTKDKSVCIANENIGAMNETGGGLSSFNCTSPENSLDFGSSPFSLSATEFFKSTDLKNKGMEDLINENYICFEEEVKRFLFPEEKDEKAGPSSTHESRQGSNEEKDAAEKGSNEEEEVFFLSDEKDEKAGPSSTSDESKQGSNEEKDAAPKGHEDDVV